MVKSKEPSAGHSTAHWTHFYSTNRPNIFLQHPSDSVMFQCQGTHGQEKYYCVFKITNTYFQDYQSSIYLLCAMSLHHSPICSSGYISYRHQSTLQSQWVFSKRLSKTSRATWRSSTIRDFVLLSFMCTLITSWEQKESVNFRSKKKTSLNLLTQIRKMKAEGYYWFKGILSHSKLWE